MPAEWKIHCITPIHKSGDRASVANYRPISLLCSTSKVMERIIYNKMIESLEPAMASSQFGFLKGRSTLQQLLTFYGTVYDDIESKCHTDVVYLDFAKAFDSVPHNELLVKLRSIGVGGDLWLWLQAYLSRRQQCVCLDKSRSELLPVISGVPQGAILGM